MDKDDNQKANLSLEISIVDNKPKIKYIYSKGAVKSQILSKAILASNSDPMELYKIMHHSVIPQPTDSYLKKLQYIAKLKAVNYDLAKIEISQKEKEQLIKDIQNKKIEAYKDRIISRHKGNKLIDFMDCASDTKIILRGVSFGKFENIEQNLYYCLDNTDLILNGFIAEPLIYRIPTDPKSETTKRILKELEPFKKINIKKDLLDKGYLEKNNYEFIKIPISDYKANTALLYALLTQKNANNKGYKYRDFIISIIQEFIYCNFALHTHHRTINRPLNFDIDTKERTKKTSQNLFTSAFITKLLLNNFLPYRNANF